jgi:hypothetical protein
MNKIKIYKNTFIVQKELRKLINILKEKIFENNGVLFGDIVANLLIVKYYKSIFEKNNNNFNYFWNNDFDKETILRTEVCNKINVYFNNLEEYIKFIDFLKNSKIFEITVIKNINNSHHINNLYEISTKLGKTLTYIGYPINVSVNIIVKIPGTNSYLEPPFNDTNFLTDILIMRKNREYKISKNTGIVEIDEMNIIEKSIFYSKILKEICNKKNYILCKKIELNNIIAKRVLEYNKNECDIVNSPLIITKCSNSFKNKCYICQYEINYDDDIMLINISKCMLHNECGYKYLEKLLETNENINCPLRQSINFINNNNNLIF